jgi:hypothetical protein
MNKKLRSSFEKHLLITPTSFDNSSINQMVADVDQLIGTLKEPIKHCKDHLFIFLTYTPLDTLAFLFNNLLVRA